MRLSLIVVASSFLLAPLAARAAEPRPLPAAPAPTRYDARFSAAEWVGAFFAGDAAGTAGALVGGAIGYGLAGSCVDDGSESSDGDWQIFGPCAFHGLGEAVIGGSVGSIFGGAAGVYAFGEATGHHGSYWAAAGGWTLGLAASFGLMAATDPDETPVGVVSLFVLPALGATAGYVLTLDDGGPIGVPTGSLVELDRGSLRLAPPDIRISRGENGNLERVDIGLVGGHF
ncbi:MAG: hypothetical protein U1F43_03185 [Myxococcota bacterium]